MCVPGRAWALTEKGHALAQRDAVVILDDLDKQVLTTLALAAMRQMQLAAQIGCCSLTAKRRLGLLVSRGLAKTDERHRYVVTDRGREAVPDAPQPWVRIEAVSAAMSRDVQERSPTDDRTKFAMAAHARKALAVGRLNKSQASNPWVEFGMTG